MPHDQQDLTELTPDMGAPAGTGPAAVDERLGLTTAVTAPSDIALRSDVSAQFTMPRSERTGQPRTGRRFRVPRVARPDDPVVWLVAAVAFAAYTVNAVSRIVRLDPGSQDIGIFTEYVRQYANFRAPIVPIRGHAFDLLGDHFTPIVAVLAPFFRLFPTPVTLVVAQALLTALSVLPICRAAREHLGTWPSRAIGFAYVFSWALQEMNDFDFHEVAFAVPLLAFSLSALVRRKPRAAVCWALPLVFVKEDQGFTVAAIGVVMLASGAMARWCRGRWSGWGDRALAPRESSRVWSWAGCLLVVWGLGWSLLAITVIIPALNPQHVYLYWADGGVVGAHGSQFSLTGLLSQFGYAGPEKLQTTLTVLVTVVFVAVRSPLLLLAVPNLFLRFASTHDTFWGTSFHYNAPLMPVVFIAGIDALARMSASKATRARPGRAWPPLAVLKRAGALVPRLAPVAMAVVAVALIVGFPLSHLWRPSDYTVTPNTRAQYKAMSMVPDGVTVEATMTMLAPMAARDTTSWIKTVLPPQDSVGIADPRYVLYDAGRSNISPEPPDVLQFVEMVHPGTVYQQVFRSHKVYLFRRVSPPVTRGH